MLFNSLAFPVFFLVVYTLYLGLRHHYKVQNVMLLAASYFFYGYWDWRFLSLLAMSTTFDFFVGKWLFATADPRRRKLILASSIVMNLGMLGIFKYFNFFADTVHRVLTPFGLQADPATLQIVLPVGLSFYTFQSMSYGIDIYR